MPNFNQIWNHVPKRRSIGTLSELTGNNLQISELFTSEAILSNYKVNDWNKSKLTPPFNISNENNKETVIVEQHKRPISFSCNVDLFKQASVLKQEIHNLPTPPDSPILCDEDNKKSRKRRSIGVNTEILVNNASGDIWNKFLVNLLNPLIIFLIIMSFIGIIIIWYRKSKQQIKEQPKKDWKAHFAKKQKL
jgi:hypothetical protein